MAAHSISMGAALPPARSRWQAAASSIRQRTGGMLTSDDGFNVESGTIAAVLPARCLNEDRYRHGNPNQPLVRLSQPAWQRIYGHHNRGRYVNVSGGTLLVDTETAFDDFRGGIVVNGGLMQINSENAFIDCLVAVNSGGILRGSAGSTSPTAALRQLPRVAHCGSVPPLGLVLDWPERSLTNNGTVEVVGCGVSKPPPLTSITTTVIGAATAISDSQIFVACDHLGGDHSSSSYTAQVEVSTDGVYYTSVGTASSDSAGSVTFVAGNLQATRRTMSAWLRRT